MLQLPHRCRLGWPGAGRELETDFGTFYPPNITPDRATGIGAWSEKDFIRAVTCGISPDGEYYFPSFPYTAYQSMSRDDVVALRAYLMSVAPVSVVEYSTSQWSTADLAAALEYLRSLR